MKSISFQDDCPLHATITQGEKCVCNHGYIAVTHDNSLTQEVANSAFCVLAQNSPLIKNDSVNEIPFITITIGSSQTVSNIELVHTSETFDNPVSIELKGNENVDKKITFTDLVPGQRYLINFDSTKPSSVEKISFPIVPSCSCDFQTNPDKSGRPRGLEVTQENGHVEFTFADNSRCETGFSFTRFSGFAEFVDDRDVVTSFTNDYIFSAPTKCDVDDAEIKPGRISSDDLRISLLPVGSTYTYCVRAVNHQGPYMDTPLSDDKGRVLSSSAAVCSSHTIFWEASFDGLITTEPNAGSLAIEGVDVTWQLLSEDGRNPLSCDGCSGIETSNQGGSFGIPIKVHHPSLRDKNTADIPVKIVFSKVTQTRNGPIEHAFLCNHGQDNCDPVQGYTFYIKHLHFDTPIHVYDDTSLPFTGYLTVYNTQYPGSDGCAIADAEVCLQHITTVGILENLVCVNSQSDGLYEAPAIIGSVVNKIQINYSSHKFEKTFKNNWDYAGGVVIGDGGFYSGNDFMDVTRAKLNIQGTSFII